MKIFGKSELQIGALIHRSLGVDLGVYVGSENLAICSLRTADAFPVVASSKFH